MATLHITNGDIAAERIREALGDADVLPWRDALNLGPVPEQRDLEGLRPIRASFIAGEGWGSYEDILRDFEARDQRLDQLSRDTDIVLWFEHDLYDQLQLLQILDYFARERGGSWRIGLISIKTHDEVEVFRGFGQLSDRAISELYAARSPVDDAILQTAISAWGVFRATDPRAVVHFLNAGSDELPFLREALMRHLHDFPWVRDGLSRSERQALSVLSDGPQTFSEVFVRTQAMEYDPFATDSALWAMMRAMANAEHPLVMSIGSDGQPEPPQDPIPFGDAVFTLADDGRRVLNGEVDAIELNGIDRWLGGVHLTARGPIWRWDDEADPPTLVLPTADS
jgi:hypothetical protein